MEEYTPKESSVSDNRVHLALSPWDLSDDYNRHAGVTLLSFLDHCSIPVTAHLLYDKNLSVGHDKEEQYNMDCYRKIAEKYGCDVQFHHVDLPKWVNEIPTVKKWTPGALMRLCLPSLLPDVNKIIYLDCDMVVTADMALLWNTDIDSYYLAACPDKGVNFFSRKRKRYNKKMNISSERYFVSGTLILNLKKIRNDDAIFTDKLFHLLKENPELPFPDQDMLNWYCQGNYFPLSQKYCAYSSETDILQIADDCIIHYAASGKPWKRYIGRIDDYYWYYLLETPWCEEKSDVLSYSRQAPVVSKCFTVIPDNLVVYSMGGVKEALVAIGRLNIRIIKELMRGFNYFIRMNLLGRKY